MKWCNNENNVKWNNIMKMKINNDNNENEIIMKMIMK